MNFAEQSVAFLEHLKTRKRSPAKPATIALYGSLMKNHIIPKIGNVDLEIFSNGKMRDLVATLTSSGCAPATVLKISSLVKQIVSSAVDAEGDQLYPRKWNHEFIDLPSIGQQRQPTATQAQVNAACQDKRYGLFYALLAGTGLRIGEALAARWGDTPDVTSLSLEKPLIFVRTSIWGGIEGLPKTPAAVREVDLDPRLWRALVDADPDSEIGEFLFPNRKGGPLFPTNVRIRNLEGYGIKGFHAFRRFRTTRLRELGVPEDIIRYWIGHAGAGITDRYSKLAENQELRRGWAVRAGLGFDLLEAR